MKKIISMTGVEKLLLERIISLFCEYCKERRRVLWDDHHKVWYHPDVYSGHPCPPGASLVREEATKMFGKPAARKLLSLKGRKS